MTPLTETPLVRALRALAAKYGRAQADVYFDELSRIGDLTYMRAEGGPPEPGMQLLKLIGGPGAIAL